MQDNTETTQEGDTAASSARAQKLNEEEASQSLYLAFDDQLAALTIITQSPEWASVGQGLKNSVLGYQEDLDALRSRYYSQHVSTGPKTEREKSMKTWTWTAQSSLGYAGNAANTIKAVCEQHPTLQTDLQAKGLYEKSIRDADEAFKAWQSKMPSTTATVQEAEVSSVAKEEAV